MEIKYRRKRQTKEVQVKKKPIPHRLSKEMVIRLITDYNAGMSLTDLVVRYGVSRNTIYYHLRRQVEEYLDNHGEAPLLDSKNGEKVVSEEPY